MFAFLKHSFFPETNCCHQTEFPRQVSHNFCLKLGQSESRGQGRHWPPPQILADQLTLSQPGGGRLGPALLRLIPPDFQTFLRHWVRCGIKSNHYHYHETKNYWQHPAECMLLLFTRVGHFVWTKTSTYSIYTWNKIAHLIAFLCHELH